MFDLLSVVVPISSGPLSVVYYIAPVVLLLSQSVESDPSSVFYCLWYFALLFVISYLLYIVYYLLLMSHYPLSVFYGRDLLYLVWFMRLSSVVCCIVIHRLYYITCCLWCAIYCQYMWFVFCGGDWWYLRKSLLSFDGYSLLSAVCCLASVACIFSGCALSPVRLFVNRITQKWVDLQ